MTPEILVSQLKASKEYLDRATRELTEEDASYAPDENSFTSAQQLGHIAQTVDWFMEGAFGAGFNMDFENHDLQARNVKTMSDARAACTVSFDKAINTFSSKTPEELMELMPAGPVMCEQPKLTVVAGIVEHTAHHRGSLSVYTRLCGKVPPMPYMEMDEAPSA
jgi:uncharacterized damage-inducible protein DinB